MEDLDKFIDDQFLDRMREDPHFILKLINGQKETIEDKETLIAVYREANNSLTKIKDGLRKDNKSLKQQLKNCRENVQRLKDNGVNNGGENE